MATALEAKALITGEDRLSPIIAAIEAKLAGITRSVRAMSAATSTVGRTAASGFAPLGREIGQVEKSLAGLSKQIGALSFAPLVRNAERQLAQLDRVVERSGRRRGRGGDGIGAAIVEGYVAGKVEQAGHAILHTYREFDKERRFGAAVMGIGADEQAPLVAQAIHGGATTKYNDIQYLEAQRELAARGLKTDQILGMMPAAASLGMALDLPLPDAVKQMEGAVFGFKKSMGTLEESIASARQTADVQVKAAKISGMSPDDIREVYKYGATPAHLAGVSEQTLLAFGAISKKANIGGDEAGVAFRALMSAATAPTAGARTAYKAAGLDYASYQHAPDRLAVDPFVRDVAEKYGVRLDARAQRSLDRVFADKATIADPSKFAPAVVEALRSVLGKQDAKSLKSISGEAGRYRSASMNAVDVNALIGDLLRKLPGNLQLANALFGAKQGGRIANALGDPATFNAMLDALLNHSQGFADKIASERMAGFDGAVSRFEGAVKNLETAFGRSLDDGGKGGLLTTLASAAASAAQALAELPPKALAFGAALGTAIAGFAAFKSVQGLMGGFGLRASATALDASAAQLSAAAVRLGASGGAHPPGSPGAPGAPGGDLFGRAFGLLGGLLGLLAQIPTPGTKQWEQWNDATTKGSDAFDQWMRAHAPWWMQPHDDNRWPFGGGGGPGAPKASGAVPNLGVQGPPARVDLGFEGPALGRIEVVPGSDLIALKDRFTNLEWKLKASGGAYGLNLGVSSPGAEPGASNDTGH